MAAAVMPTSPKEFARKQSLNRANEAKRRGVQYMSHAWFYVNYPPLALLIVSSGLMSDTVDGVQKERRLPWKERAAADNMLCSRTTPTDRPEVDGLFSPAASLPPVGSKGALFTAPNQSWCHFRRNSNMFVSNFWLPSSTTLEHQCLMMGGTRLGVKVVEMQG